jgi:hypothetical protein
MAVEAAQAVEEIHVMAGINPAAAGAVAAVAAAAVAAAEIHVTAEIKTVAVKVEIITTITPQKKVGDPLDIQLQIAKVICGLAIDFIVCSTLKSDTDTLKR